MKSSLKSLFMRSLQHQVLYYAPQLSPHEVRGFLHWAFEKNLNLDWKMHLHLLHWLTQAEQVSIEPEMIKELLIASATRWSLIGLDHLDAKGIVVASPLLPGTAFGLWKSKQPQITNKLVRIKMVVGHLVKTSYAISYQQDTWDKVEWVAVST